MTPIERIARWFALSYGMKCRECGNRLPVRHQVFCGAECDRANYIAEAW